MVGVWVRFRVGVRVRFRVKVRVNWGNCLSRFSIRSIPYAAEGPKERSRSQAECYNRGRGHF